MSHSPESSNKPLITRDWLATERTKLANEWTFLAYFRIFLVILGTGVTILKLEFFSDLKSYGIVLIIVSAFVLGIGIYRLFKVKKLLESIIDIPMFHTSITAFNYAC